MLYATFERCKAAIARASKTAFVDARQDASKLMSGDVALRRRTHKSGRPQSEQSHSQRRHEKSMHPTSKWG